jgi:hypothetical protein
MHRCLRADGPDHGPSYRADTGKLPAISVMKATPEAVATDIGESGYRAFRGRGQRLVMAPEDAGKEMGHSVSVPDLAGCVLVHVHDNETDPTEWTEWRDVNA